MKSTTMKDSLPLVAKAMGRNMGVKVQFYNGGAKTDGSTIYLPHLPLNDPEVNTLGLGLIIHEAGHIRYSDFSESFLNRLQSLNSSLIASLGNCFEDVRMELCVMRDYPGAEKHLNKLMAKLIEDEFFSIQAATPPDILLKYLLFNLRYWVLGQECFLPLAEHMEAELAKAMTPLAITRINSVLPRVAKTKSENEVLTLAVEVAAILQEEVEKNQQQQASSGDDQQDDDQSDDDTTSDQSNDTANSDTDTDDDGNSSQDGDSDSSDDAGQQTSNQGDSQDDSNGSGDDALSPSEIESLTDAMQSMLSMTEDDAPQDISDALNDLIKKEVKEASHNRGNHPINIEATNTNQYQLEGAAHQQALFDAQSITTSLRTRMTRLVQANAKAKRNTSKHGRRLNGRKVHKIKSGNSSVFKSVSRKKAVNTAVHVLLDRSWSMKDGMQLASLSTLSLVAALKSVPNVSVGASAFPGMGDSAAIVLTSPDQSVNSTAGYYANVVADGNTPLSEALLYAGHSLSIQKEERKILLVLTDGEPNNIVSSTEIVGQLKRSGMEVYGLGINVDDHVQQTINDVFHGSVEMANTVPDVAPAIFSLLENTLF